jgi:hypothetical protein
MDDAHRVLAAIRRHYSRDRRTDDTLTRLADYMLGGHLAIRHGHIPKNLEPIDELKFTPESIDWDMEWPPITNTCQLYLHFLDPAKTLIQAYEVQPDPAVVDLAVDITRSWLHYAATDAGSRFTWYDHCAAERTANLIYLAETIAGDDRLWHHRDFAAGLRDAIADHAAWLADDDNYVGQNHGTMMDRSFYLAGRYLSEHAEAEGWRAKAVERLRAAFVRDYSAGAVNLENSSSYHLFNFDLYVGVEKNLLNVFGDTLGDGFDDWTRKAVLFLVHLSKPDHALPMIGDGSRMSLDMFPRHPSYPAVERVPQLRHVLTDGRKGKPPKRLMAVWRDEGYAFMRTSWDYRDRDEITYASFRAGRLLNNHKHADDLSFTLYAHGRDIFVDSGTYTYEPGAFRNHFLSPMAHNTVVVDGSTYPVVQGNPTDARIVDSGARPGFRFVTAVSTAYPGVTLTRRLIFLDSGRLVLVDDATSDEEHTYSQMFHLAHRLDATTVRVDGPATTVPADDVTIRLRQLQPCALDVHRGRADQPGPGVVSEAFGELHETVALEYRQTARTTRFVTAVTVDREGAAPFEVRAIRRGLRVVDGEVLRLTVQV